MTVSASAKKRRSSRRRRRRARQRQQPASSRAKKLDRNSQDTLRERWVDILSLEGHANNNSVRIRQEEQYYYEAEILADKLLGLDDDNYEGRLPPQKDSRKMDSLLSKELSIMWKSIAIASSVILIGIPVASLFNSILTSNMMQSMLSSIQSSITPYLVPTISIIQSSIQNYLLQAQAILHSMPYLLRHLNHIKIHPGPFLYKLIRKCIILEAWRHIWIRVYKLTRYLWKGTLRNAKSAYVRLCPAWIRRGVKSVFQSMVQAHVHGAVGGFVGSALSGVTFDSSTWASWSSSSSSSGDGGSSSSSVLESENMLESIVQESAVNEAMAESMMDSAAQSLETAIDSVSLEDTMDALTESVGSAVVEETMDALLESVESSIEDAVESIAEEAMDALVESAESSMIESAVESFVEDCLSEGCVDELVESVLE